MFETIVAIQSIANIRYRNACSGDAPVERFSTVTTQALLGATSGDLYRPPAAASALRKALLLAFGTGLVVGVVFSLVKLPSPAPPFFGLIGLVGMFTGQRLWPFLASRFFHH
jgi:XapX domain-containing protein